MKAEYERLRDTSLCFDPAEMYTQKNVIPVVLLNIWSLESHSVDIKF